MLQVVLIDNGMTTYRCKTNIFLKVADNEKKNVNFPEAPLKCMVAQGKAVWVFHFKKIDPTKAGWGDISVEIQVCGPNYGVERQIPSTFQRNTNI